MLTHCASSGRESSASTTRNSNRLSILRGGSLKGCAFSASTVLPQDSARRFGAEQIPQQGSETCHRGPILPWSHDQGERLSEPQGTADLTGSTLYGTLYE